MLPKGFKLSSRLWLSSLGVVSTCLLLVYALLGISIWRGDNHMRYYSDVLVCNGTSQERSYENSTYNNDLNLTSDTMINLTVDTPDPKLIGNGKDLIQPLMKRVVNFQNNIILFSAVAGNSSSKHIWDTIDIQGWEHKSLSNNTYKCCVRYTSGALRMVPAIRINWTNWVTEMNAVQFVCSNLTSRTGDLPDVATIATHKMECHNLYDWHLPVTFAHAHKNEIAVCSKFVYGSVAADDLLSWFELHRRLGVTKVLVYTHKLNPEAFHVLRYYRALGIADTVPFIFRLDDQHNHPEIGVKNVQAWNDEQVPVFDCLARLRGYRYLALVDTDEYLISNRGLPWMNMLDDLSAKHPSAAGFNFYVKVHVTSWNKARTCSQFKVGQYLNSTRPMTERWKHVTMPDRLRHGSQTHTFNPNEKAGFNRHVVSAEDAVIHHFRSCRTQWIEENSACIQFGQSADDTVSKLFEKIEPDVLKLKARIFESQ
ncbi:hypothetical protein DPMN_078508 [Dreissena polymorpha]|uniref:Glycosyltransferase family 92 protein n=2 Tax=Dreissena polymorpha TaxID=45954 RepID=A0A9D4BS75_DREPO|nr:hypothetical protein DPMN_078508 [Dreissena polymorpha]